MQLIITTKAKQHIQQATRWYERQQPGLGYRFVESVTTELEAIRSAPHRRPTILDDVRIAILKTFPYLVFYRIRTDQVRVLAVLHSSRDPQGWLEFS